MAAIDVHRYLGASLFGAKTTASSILKDMERLGIERSVLVPVKPRRYALEPEVERVARAVEANASRFSGWCRVDPWQRERALKLLERGLDELGLVGLFLHPWQEQFQISSSLVDPLVELSVARRKPVMIVGGHVRVSQALQVAELVGRFPEATFIVTSGGQINISGAALGEAEVLMRENPNVMMETSGIYREDFIEDSMRTFGASRVLWGSASPEYDVDFELHRALWAHVDDGARSALLRDNARRVVLQESSSALDGHQR
jgi:predicted TIM-barrel fold metal-dependent hydrolase